ncbi:transcriptional regulator [Terriglobus roseus DSM 18391]|uniref:Transcriptional regulator n=1 Tax=Terriglobus roseus (strain DSM 18391 / NRRL B-41598 / KBS 63) TaxID=926566 RepID=I3ZE00_TERRK|nr:GntR family transcriptional regulator [Terriglobus roseus]AFL87468.1 transcriptional regulator [Terriglobus roseus DSM 18391]
MARLKKVETQVRRPTRRSTVPARERVYQHIRSQINSGELAPGKPLSELLLAKELGSSRTPVREAISLLVSEGILETTHNRGAQVRKLTRSDIIDLCEVREAMELFTAEKAARNGLLPQEVDALTSTIAGIRELRDSLPDVHSALNDQGMAQFTQLDRRFHEQIVRLTLNRAMHEILRKAGVLVQIFSMRRRGHTRAMLDRVLDEHMRIAEALQKNDPEAVRSLLAAHIQNSMRERLEEFDSWERSQLISRKTSEERHAEEAILF